MVVERSNLARESAGEHLSPDGVVALGTMGLGASIAASSHTPCPYIESAWGGPDVVVRDYMSNAHGPGINLDRLRFDAWMRAQVVEDGGRLVNGSYPGMVTRTNSGWIVKLVGSAQGMVIRTRFLVDATGRSVWLGRRFGATIHRLDNLVAIIGLLQAGRDAKEDNGRLLIEATKTGWWYSVCLASGRTVASSMLDANMVRHGGVSPEEAWRRHLTLAPFTAARCSGRVLVRPVRVASANSQCVDRPIGDRWLVVGDAAQAYDPLSSMGISKGIRHGIAAADAAAAHLRGDMEALPRYARGLARDFTAYMESRHMYYTMEQRWPGASFWESRHTLPPRDFAMWP